MDTVVEVRDVWEGYRTKTRRGGRRRAVQWALAEVSFHVAPGEMLGIIGPNGAGKTTLLQCLAGVLEPTRGSLTRRSPVASLTDLAAGFHRELTGKENALFGSVLSGMSREEARARYSEIVAFSGIEEDKMQSPLRTYSAGMTLRLGFSVAVHVRPSLLLVDEVLAVGDQAFQKRCLDKVAELRAGGCGVVVVSHDLDLIAQTCDRCLVLQRGRVEFAGGTGEAIEFYRERTGGAPPAQDFSREALFGRARRRRRRRT